MANANVNISFGATVSNFIAGVAQMRSEVGQLATQINTNLTASFAAADRQQRVFDRGIGRVADNLKDFGRSASVVSAGLSIMGVSAFKAYADIDGIQRALTVTAGSAQEATKQFGQFRELAKLPGLGLEEVTQAGLQLETLGYNAKTAGKYVSEIGNAIALGGKGKAEFGSVITQFTQMSGKAKVLSEDLKPILTASPVISKAITEMFGSVDPEKISGILQAAGRGPKEFINDLVLKLSELDRVAGGPKNALENLGDSFTIAGYEAAKAADNAFGLTTKLDSLGTFVSSTATQFGAMSPAIQGVTLGLVGTAAAVGPLAFGLGSLIGFGPQFIRGFQAMGAAIGFITGPIGLTLGAVAALGVAAYSVYQFGQATETAANKAKLLADTQTEVARATANEEAKLTNLLRVARDESEAKQVRLQAIKDINAISPKYLGDLSLETINTNKAAVAVQNYTRSITLRAQARAFESKYGESVVKEAELKTKPLNTYTGPLDRLGAAFRNVFTGNKFNQELEKSLQGKAIERQTSAFKVAGEESEFYRKGLESVNAQLAKMGEAPPPAQKSFNYSEFFNGSQKGIQAARAELEKLADEIYQDGKKGIDTTAKRAQYDELKAELKSQTAFTRDQKTAVQGVGDQLTVNERILKRLSLAYKENGDTAGGALSKTIALLQQQVDLDNARLKNAKEPHPTFSDIQPLRIGQPELTAPILPVALGVTLDPVMSRNVNAQILGIKNNVLALKDATPGLFDKTGIKDFLTPLQLAGPSLDFYRNKIEEIRSTIATLSLNKVKVPPELLEQLKLFKKYLQDATSGANVADILTNTDSDSKDLAPYVEKAKKRIAAMQAAGVEVKQAAEEMAKDMKTAEEALKGKALGILSAVGESIGAGQDPLKILLKSIMGMLGDFLIQLGTKVVLAGSLLSGLETVAPFLIPFLGPVALQGPGAIVAGGAMVLGGGIIKGFAGSFAGGGLFKGESFIRVGENSRAIAGGGEFVAPVQLGADLISSRIMKNLRQLEVKRPNMNSLQPMRIQVDVQGETVTRGADIFHSYNTYSNFMEYHS